DRETGIYIHRARPGHEEVLRREVLQIIRRQHLWDVAVHYDLPAREEARVPLKEPLRLSRGGIDVADAIADDECVSFEDDGRAAGHTALLLTAVHVISCPAAPLREEVEETVAQGQVARHLYPPLHERGSRVLFATRHAEKVVLAGGDRALHW